MPKHGHPDKADIAAQLVRRADEWIRHAEPKDLLRVMLRGGLSPVIVEEDGRILTGIALSDRAGMLSGVGMIWKDLTAAETLAIFAQVWGASDPPASIDSQEAWLAADSSAQAGARRFLHDEVDENIALFGACVDEWLGSNQR
ncbi:hypothetical protein J7E70_04075 [Variovorax paradoxus]|nr:hypothetical protein [Variovorax paradoxus]MBT2299635.1 hypothetical protein [Variovorax paradoxus]